MGNQYEADYQKLREFADTTVNQIDSSISHTIGYDGATKKRDRKLTAKGLEYQLSLLREKKRRLEARLTRKAATIENLFTAARTSSQLRKSWLSMMTYLN